MDFDLKTVEKAWKKYVASGEEIPETVDGVRREIVDSWRRCKGVVDPLSRTLPYATPDELKKKLEENELLVNIAYPYLLKFYECLAGTNHQFMLTDAEGCQLKIINEGDLLSEMTTTKGFTNGKLYSEEAMGTNGIGTCLVLEKPIMIRGPEHFHVLFNNVCCYGAPIYDPSSHKIIGCINITGPLEYYNTMIMGMLAAAVKGIEKEFKLTKANNMLNFISDNNPSGILLIDSDSRIIHFNSAAAELLKLNRNDITKHRIDDILSPDSPQPFLESPDKKISNLECTLVNKNGVPIDLCISVTPQSNSLKSFGATLIKFDSQLSMHRIANQMAGFFAYYTFDSISGNSAALKNVKELGKIAAKLESPILITGEQGTGKEMLAQAIHNESPYKNGPFVTVHCGSIPIAKLDNDLWGHEGNPSILGKEKGKPGKIELANEGTLFISDIGNMPLETQSRLLNFLKTKQFMRAGGKYPKTSNIRIIGSSKVNLLSLVEKKMFRSDLYYMLSTFNIIVPPLRERPEDIMILAQKYAEQLNTTKQSFTFDKESSEALINYRWQGNMRQLESVIENAVNAARKNSIRLSNLPLDIINDYYSGKQHSAFSEEFEKENEKFFRNEIKEYNRILLAVKKTCGNTKETAAMLNMPLSTLYRKLAKYEIDVKDYRS